MTDELMRLRLRYEAWCTKRAQLVAMEDEGNYPMAQEWHGSDDDAVTLMYEMAAALGFGGVL